MPPLGRENFVPTPKTEAELAIERALINAKQQVADKVFAVIESHKVCGPIYTLPSRPYEVADQPEGTKTQALLYIQHMGGSLQVELRTGLIISEETGVAQLRNVHAVFDNIGRQNNFRDFAIQYDEFSPTQELELLGAMSDTLEYYFSPSVESVTSSAS